MGEVSTEEQVKIDRGDYDITEEETGAEIADEEKEELQEEPDKKETDEEDKIKEDEDKPDKETSEEEDLVPEFLEEPDEEGKGEEIDPDLLEEISKDNESKGIPLSRASRMSATKNAALDLTQAMIDGVVDQRWVEDMGGVKEVASGMASGRLTLPDKNQSAAESSQPLTSEKTTSLEADLDRLNDEYREAYDSGDDDGAKDLNKKIQTTNRQLAKEEFRLERAAERRALAQQEVVKDNQKVDIILDDLFELHPELNDVDSVEYITMNHWRTKHLNEGKPLSEALTLATVKAFPKKEKEPEKEVEQKRKEEAVKRNLKAQGQQPPPVSGAGVQKAGVMKKASEMTEAEWDKLSQEEKDKAKGNAV